MAIERLYLIPDYNNIEESLKLSEKWETGFEYNDFFDPNLLDDRLELESRINKYKSLERHDRKDTLHGVFYDICVNSVDKRIKEISESRMLKSIEIARNLDCRAIIYHTNLIPGFEVPFYLDGWCEVYVEFYTKICKEHPDLEILVENMFDYKPDMLIKLAEQMDKVPNFGVCYDVAHGNLHDVSMSEWMHGLSRYIKHMHINDNDGTGDYHLSLGKGNINWEEYFGLIDDLGIPSSILVEVSDIEKQVESLTYLKERGYIA